jgi:carbon monoxide dehydrogenase subunit G
MGRTSVTRHIDAPVATVFATLADLDRYARAIPHIVRIEYLNDRRAAVGSRFRETRLMNGKEVSTELEVTELEPNERLRMVADTHGTVWDSVFTVAPEGDGTRLSMVMNSRSRSLVARAMIAMIGGRLRTAVEHDMDLLKAFCERAPEGTANAR